MGIWLSAISSIGFPAVFAMYLIYQGHKEKQDYNNRIDEKDRDNRAFTNERITELRRESKEDKKIFEMSVNTFSKTVDKMDVLIKDVNEIKQDVKTLNREVYNIKEEK